jgi:hypothetical protein
MRVHTSNSSPLYDLSCLCPFGPRILQRRAPTVLALEAELVFWRELRHVRGPLALWWVAGVVFDWDARVGVDVGICFSSGFGKGRFGGL